MHVVMTNTGTVSNSRTHGFLGFFFLEDATSQDIPLFTTINDNFASTIDEEKKLTLDLYTFLNHHIPENS